MPTTRRAYSYVSAQEVPDFPARMNRALDEIDQDMGKVNDTATTGVASALSSAKAATAAAAVATEGVAAARTEAKAATNSAANAASAATTARVLAAELAERIRAVETLGGLAPGELSDATALAILANPGSQFRQYVDANYGARVAVAATAHGVSPANTPEANRAGLQAAYDEALAAGLPLELPTTGPGQEVRIDGEIVCGGAGAFGGGGVEIFAQGYARIRQMTKPEPIFNVQARTTIRAFHGVGAGLDMTGMVTAVNFARYAAVWLNAGSDGSRVTGVKGTGLHRVVRVDPDPTTTATPAQVPNIRDLKVLDIESEDCWAGITAVGFDGLEISVRGNYLKAFNSGGVDSTGQPPHLVYIIDRDSVGRVNYNLTMGPSVAWDSGVPIGASGGEPAAAYAIKGVVGLTYTGLLARNCAGILDLINVTAVQPGSAVSIDDVYPLDGGRASVAIKDSRNAHIRATVVAKAGGDYGRQLYVESTCTDSLIDVELTANPTTARTGANTGVGRISGKRNEVRAKVTNLGAPMQAALSVSSTSTLDVRLVEPVTSGPFRFPVELLQGSGTVVEYDSARLPFDTTLGADAAPVYTGSSAFRSVLRDRGAAQAPVYGYVDTFNRPDSPTSLGTTDDGQNYVLLNNGSFGVESNMLRCGLANTGGAYALPEGGRANGTITITIGTVGTNVDGYMLRTDYAPAGGAAFPQDFLRLVYRSSSSSAVPKLQVRSGGGTITDLASAAAGTALAAGDVLTVTLAGSSVTVAQNGTTIITATDSAHSTRVASGPMVASPASGHWKLDEIRFQPTT